MARNVFLLYREGYSCVIEILGMVVGHGPMRLHKLAIFVGKLFEMLRF